MVEVINGKEKCVTPVVEIDKDEPFSKVTTPLNDSPQRVATWGKWQHHPTHSRLLLAAGFTSLKYIERF